MKQRWAGCLLSTPRGKVAAMSFLTPEVVRAVRLKGSEKVSIDGLPAFQLVKVSGDAALAISDHQKKLEGTAAERREAFLFILKSAITDEKGNFLSDEDIAQLFGVLSLDDVMGLISKITTRIAEVTSTPVPSVASPTGA